MKFFKLYEIQNFYADIILLLLSILICYYGVTATSYTTFGINILYDLKNNWSLKPITDIKVSNTICPTDYEPITSYRWPGTVKGCYCEDFILGSSLTRGYCSKKSYCNNIIPYRARDVNVWDGNIICGKREGLNYFDYINSFKYRSSDSCDLSEKTCGTLDNLGKKLCVSKNEVCGINDIIFSTSTSQYSGYNQLQLNSDKSLLYTNENVKNNAII